MLWVLTGRVADAHAELQASLDKVGGREHGWGGEGDERLAVCWWQAFEREAGGRVKTRAAGHLLGWMWEVVCGMWGLHARVK